MSGNLREISKILKDDRIDINETDLWGRRPLIEACYAGQLETVEFLFKFPTIDINVVDELWRTPLNISLRRKFKKIVEILLKREKVKIDEKSVGLITSLI